MRILHIVTAFPRAPGDVIAPWLVELLRRLRMAGVEAEVLSSSYKGAPDHVLEGIPVYRFRYFPRRWENLTHEEAAPDRIRTSLLYRIMPTFFVVFGMLAAWRHCRARRYDVIHVHWPMPMALMGWSARAASGNAPLVMTFYGAELRWITRTLTVFRGLLRRIIRSADRIVAISSYTRGEILRLEDVPVEVIPYTVSLPAAPSDEPSRAVARMGADPNDFRVLFVGRLVERKGVHVLLHALTLVPAAARVVVEIVGDGPERHALEISAATLGVASRVRFLGKVSDEALQRAYARASAFVLPAVTDARGDTEGLGVVLLEAMNWRVPVIASETGGITDIVQHERTGLLVPPSDAPALAGAIERLAADPLLAGRLGADGHAHLERHFTWDAIVERWLAVYRDVAALTVPRREPLPRDS